MASKVHNSRVAISAKAITSQAVPVAVFGLKP